jgi:hypothetical protein
MVFVWHASRRHGARVCACVHIESVCLRFDRVHVIDLVACPVMCGAGVDHILKTLRMEFEL